MAGWERLAATVKTAIRMLDNVVDINFYPTPEARNSNLKHRAIGLGIMGFQDALYELDLPFESEGATDFADRAMELVSYHAILASSRLAKERGPYASYGGSKWDRGLLPLDTVDLLEEERGVAIDLPRTQRKFSWDRADLQEHPGHGRWRRGDHRGEPASGERSRTARVVDRRHAGADQIL